MSTFDTIVLIVFCVSIFLVVSSVIFLGNKTSVDSPQKLLLLEWGILIGGFVLNCVLKAFGLEH